MVTLGATLGQWPNEARQRTRSLWRLLLKVKGGS
jgi:hypothetical protein